MDKKQIIEMFSTQANINAALAKAIEGIRSGEETGTISAISSYIAGQTTLLAQMSVALTEVEQGDD